MSTLETNQSGWRKPVASASQRAKHEACEASLAREREAWMFSKKYNIAGFKGGAAADRGNTIHDVISKIPIRCTGFTQPKESHAQAIERICSDESIDLSSYNKYVAKMFAVTRDSILEYGLSKHPGGISAVEKIDLNIDSERLHAHFSRSGERSEYSGLPDFLAKISGGGKTTAVLIDYKSGFTRHKPASINPQIHSLVGLSGILSPEIDTIYSALVSEEGLGENLEIAAFSKAAIQAHSTAVEDLSFRLNQHTKKIADSPDGHPSPAISAQLDAAATTGNHCLHCEGQVCCNVFKQKAANDAIYKLEPQIGKIKEFKDKNNKRKKLQMTPIELSESLALATAIDEISKPFANMLDKSSELIGQLIDKGIAVDDAESIPSTRGRDKILTETVEDLFKRLSPLMPGVTFDTFRDGVQGGPDATKLKKFIAPILGVKDSKVVETLGQKLAEETPIKRVNFANSIKSTADISDIIEAIETRSLSLKSDNDKTRKKAIPSAESPAPEAEVTAATIEPAMPAPEPITATPGAMAL